MIDLQPFSRGQNCLWKDFELGKFNNQLSHETGVKITLDSDEYIYLGLADRFTFYGSGAY